MNDLSQAEVCRMVILLKLCMNIYIYACVLCFLSTHSTSDFRLKNK